MAHVLSPSFLEGFFEDNPRLAILGSIPQAGDVRGQRRVSSVAGRPAFQNFWRGQTGDIFDQYLQQFARRPQTTVTGFLENFPWLERFGELSPSARGESPALHAPRIRFQ